MTPLESAVIAAAKDLVASVSFDDNGALIGGKWVGGHGGLLSDESRRRADVLRRAIDAAEPEPTQAEVEA